MRYAQFFHASTGYVAGSMPPRFDGERDLIPACGSDGVFPIDGRYSDARAASEARAACKRRGFAGFTLNAGPSYGNARVTRPLELVGSHAAIVAGLIERAKPQAVTLAYGYMVTLSGRRVIFSDHYGDRAASPPRMIGERRNKAGRCTAVTAEYRDGSRLRFTWSEVRGPRYTVEDAPTNAATTSPEPWRIEQ